MMPTLIVRLDRYAFGAATSACRGEQVAAVVGAIGEARRTLVWYGADVQVIGPPFVARREPVPVYVGDTATMVRVASAVDQFESGVLVAVSDKCTNPKFRSGGLWTEDEETADLGDALVEIRAFDTTYISVATNEEEIVKCLQRV